MCNQDTPPAPNPKCGGIEKDNRYGVEIEFHVDLRCKKNNSWESYSSSQVQAEACLCLRFSADPANGVLIGFTI